MNACKKSRNAALMMMSTLLALSGSTQGAMAAAKEHRDIVKATKIPGRYIIQFKKLKEQKDQEKLELQALKEAQVPKDNIREHMQGAIEAIVADLSQEQIKKLKLNRAVKSIENDQLLELDPEQAKLLDPLSGAYLSSPAGGEQQVGWGPQRTGYGNGSGKVIWVIDSGIVDHPDLKVDFDRSASFITGITSVIDGYGHGTCVAGAAAAKNNTIGAMGVAHDATIVALRVFDDYGRGSTSSAIKAVNYVAASAKAGDVVNMSLGGGISSTLDNVVIAAADKGIFFAIAAGNSGIDASNNSPARVNHLNVYTVSAIDHYDQQPSWSNYGSMVDRAAPGTGILCTDKNGSYGSGSGTSLATPHVAGILALNGRAIGIDGYAKGDKDGVADPIAVVVNGYQGPYIAGSASPEPAPADTQTPSVALTSPADGATLTGTISLSASASDNVGVKQVDFYLNGSLIGSATAAPYSMNLDTTQYADSTASLQAKARDAAGNVGSSAVFSVSISNAPSSPSQPSKGGGKGGGGKK